MYTHLDWVLSGPVFKTNLTVCHTNFAMTNFLQVDAEPDTLEDRMQAFWEFESMEVQLEEEVASTEVDAKYQVPRRSIRGLMSCEWMLNLTP